MKTHRLKYAILAAITAMALAPSASHAQATNILIQPVGATVMVTSGSGNQTSSSGGGGVWQNWFVNNPGITNYQIIYDTTNPPPTGSLGSMLQVQEWDGITAGTMSTFACVDGDFWGGQKVNMQQYQFIELDFRFDTTSTMVPTNAMGVNIGVNANNNGNSGPISATPVVNNGAMATNFDGAWHHMVLPIDSAVDAVNSEGVGFGIFNQATTIGSFKYWVANIQLTARTNAPPNPSVFISATKPGLKQFANAVPNYNRQDIRTDTAAAGSKNLDWVGHPGATYSWTISEWPSTAAGYQGAVTFSPDPAESITFADPDWGTTNCLWINFVAQGDGTVTTVIRCKTNQPAGNSQMFGGTGMLGTNSLNSPTAIGTWSLTFTDNTHVTLNAPGGFSTNVVLDAGIGDISSYNNVSFCLYTSMSSDGNLGKSTTFTSVSATGVANPFNEDLTDGALNTPFLRLQSQGYGNAITNPPNQIFVTSADSYWLRWTLPAAQFTLVAKPTLDSGTWLDYGPSPILANGTSNMVLASTASLPAPDSSYFALLKRTNFTQLQILLPGETAAPNTVSGKTGTPSTVFFSTSNGEMVVTVRACDPDWNLISVTDTINLTTDDASATLVPANMAMVNGVASFVSPNVMTFGNVGTFTVTATNMSRVMPAVTSAPVVVDF